MPPHGPQHADRGFGFMPVVHESTGAIGRIAHDGLIAPLLKRLQDDEEARQVAAAALELRGPLPWNVRSVRALFLKRVGVVVARGVGGAIAAWKWQGRQLLGVVHRARRLDGVAGGLLRRPSGLARVGLACAPCSPAGRAATVS